MNILVSAIGSMSSEAVIKSLRRIENVKIIGCDIYKAKWIYPSKLVDVFYQVSRADSFTYINDIIDICLKENIEYFFPLTDLEIDILTEYRYLFDNNGIVLCISSSDTINICRDKKKLFDFLSNTKGLLLLPTYNYENICNCVNFDHFVAKPKKGRSSEGLYIFDDIKKLDILIKDKQSYIFQPYIKGSINTIDVVVDTFNNLFFVSREELIRTKNGAGITVRLFNEERLYQSIKSLTNKINFTGCFNVEFIFNGDDYLLMDINPRFSAGIAFSQSVGYDFVRNHLKAFMHEKIDPPLNYKERIICKRYIEYF